MSVWHLGPAFHPASPKDLHSAPELAAGLWVTLQRTERSF